MQEMQETWVQSLAWEDPREGNGNPLQYSGLKNPTDREAWQATVLGVAESDMTERLSVSTALLRGKFLSLFELRPGALKFTILRPLISKLPISWSFLCIFMGRRSRRKGRLPSPPIPPSLGETNSFVVVQLLSPDSLRPHGLQQARVPCPSPSPGACSDSCPFRQWCHPTILSSVVLFSSCLQSFPASGLFQWVGSSHQVAKVLELQLQHQSFQWIFRIDFL